MITAEQAKEDAAAIRALFLSMSKEELFAGVVELERIRRVLLAEVDRLAAENAALRIERDLWHRTADEFCAALDGAE